MVHEPDLLDQLTESQQQAVLHEVGPLLVLAGPGSGALVDSGVDFHQ